jgi:DHA2 family multidrug resistance protein
MSSPFKEPEVSRRDWIAVGGAILGAFMAILDVSITNASLKDVQGALSASIDEGSWISTAYLIAEIIVIPMTGFFAKVFSLRRYLMVNASLFLVFSMLCGLSWNLPSMIVFRTLQGLAGGILIPMAATLIMMKLPVSKRPFGFALFSISATCGPALGPTIGGWLTVNYSWQYIFYLNLIPGAVLIGCIAHGLDEAPMQLNLLKGADWFGILAMALALASITYVLEEGNRKDWFGSPEISWAGAVFVVSIISFLWIELKQKNPFINIRLLKRRNFALTNTIQVLFGVGLYGSAFIIPLYMATVQGYNALQIGQVMMWIALPQLVLSPLVPLIMKRMDSRILIVFGTVLFGWSAYINSRISFDIAGPQLMFTNALRAFGQPFIMVPLSSLAYEGIEPSEIGSASGLYNMMRNLGGSFGIGILGTVLAQRYQFHFSRLTEKISQIDLATQSRIAQVTAAFMSKGFSATTAHSQAIVALGKIINRESYILGYGDCFLFIAVGFAASAVFTLFLKKVKATNAPPADH